MVYCSLIWTEHWFSMLFFKDIRISKRILLRIVAFLKFQKRKLSTALIHNVLHPVNLMYLPGTKGRTNVLTNHSSAYLLAHSSWCVSHLSHQIAVNGQHFTEFRHRIPFQRISHVAIDGDTVISSIQYPVGSGGIGFMPQPSGMPYPMNPGMPTPMSNQMPGYNTQPNSYPYGSQPQHGSHSPYGGSSPYSQHKSPYPQVS